MTKTLKSTTFFFTLILFLTGCKPLIKTEQPSLISYIAMEQGYSVGQSFTARHAGLEGVVLFLKPEEPGDGVITLRVYKNPPEASEVARAMMPVAGITKAEAYAFRFKPIKSSSHQDFYLVLSQEGTGKVSVGIADGESYLDGSLYRDGVPVDQQLTFHLVYQAGLVAMGLLQEGVNWLVWLIVAGFLFVIPGWALLRLGWKGWEKLSWAEKLGLSCGVSLALYPLLFLWTNVFNLHIYWLYAWIPPVFGLALILWLNRATLSPRYWLKSLSACAHSPHLGQDIALLFTLGLVFLIRFWVIRSLNAPMWGDAVQHATIAQLLVERGGLFDSWEPYAPYHSLTVHFGFPAAAALWTWLTHLSPIRSTLVVGQVINGLSILGMLPLSVYLIRGNRWAGVGTVLVVGLLSPMPAHYVNWGRFAQLTGQAVLPVALWLFIQTLEESTDKRASIGLSSFKSLLAGIPVSSIALAGIALAGMILCYYRMPFYYVSFILAWLIGWGLPHWRGNRKCWLVASLCTVLIGGIGVLLFSPSLERLASSNLQKMAEVALTIAPPISSVLESYKVWLTIPSYLPTYLLVLSLIAFLWSLFRKQWWVSSVVLWFIFLAGLILGQAFNIPGLNMIDHFAILIAVYLPAGLMIGWLIGETASAFVRKKGLIGQILSVGLILLVGLWGTWRQRLIVKPQIYNMVTRPDIRAMSWIREHTPIEALFLVEGFRPQGGSGAVGADAGWWIPLYTQRKNTMPPQYALINEVPIPPDYSKRVVELVATLETNAPASPEGIHTLCHWGITHIYIGQNQGRTGFEAMQLFKPEDFIGKDAFIPLYHQDLVFIFSLAPSACQIK